METGLIHAPRFSLIHHCATLRKGSAVLRARASILDPRVSLAMIDELTFWFINFSDTKLLLSFYIESKRKFTCLKLNMARKRHCQIKFYAHFPKQLKTIINIQVNALFTNRKCTYNKEKRTKFNTTKGILQVEYEFRVCNQVLRNRRVYTLVWWYIFMNCVQLYKQQHKLTKEKLFSV